MKTSRKVISVVMWLVALLLVWQGVSYLLSDILLDPLAEKKAPNLLNVGAFFLEYGGNLFHQAGVTFGYAAGGFFIGAAAGIILALIMHLSSVIEKMILPYLLASQMIPILGLAPIVFGLVKDIAMSRLVIAAYITFFPVAVNLLSGLKAAAPEHLALVRSYAANQLQLYTKLLCPFSLPYLFAGLKISAPMAVTAAILVDTLSARDGIGYVIIFTLYGGGTTGQFWPAIVIAAVMGIISFFLITAVEYAVVPWKRGRGADA